MRTRNTSSERRCSGLALPAAVALCFMVVIGCEGVSVPGVTDPGEPSGELLCPSPLEPALHQDVCIESCGNGIVDDGEWCDDGNVYVGDGCPSDCQRCAKSWQLMPADPRWHLTSISGTGPEDLFAVGAIGPQIVTAGTLVSNNLSSWSPHEELADYDGAAFHYDGQRWRRMVEGIPPLYSIWVTKHDMGTVVFAVGAEGTILHYDGADWAEMESPVFGTDEILTGVWGSSVDNVFAIGVGGTALHYDGERWSALDLPDNVSGLLSIVGLDADADGAKATGGVTDPAVFLAGTDGVFLRYRPGLPTRAAQEMWEVRDDSAKIPHRFQPKIRQDR